MSPKEGADTGVVVLVVIQNNEGIPAAAITTNVSPASPAFVIDAGGCAVSWGGGGEEIDDEAFIVATNAEIHVPTEIGGPMPIEGILIAASVPGPIDLSPQLIASFGNGLFSGRALVEILTHGEQTLNEEGGFNQIASIVFLAEWFRFSSRSDPPVRPDTVESVCCF